MRRLIFATVLALLGLNLAACSVAAPQRVNVNLATYHIQLSTQTLAAGKVTFVVRNDATDLTHELVVARTDLPIDQISVDEATHTIDEEAIEILGEVEDVDSGATKRLTLDLPPGRYVLICNLAEHYGHGMRAEFTVTP